MYSPRGRESMGAGLAPTRASGRVLLDLALSPLLPRFLSQDLTVYPSLGQGRANAGITGVKPHAHSIFSPD